MKHDEMRTNTEAMEAYAEFFGAGFFDGAAERKQEAGSGKLFRAGSRKQEAREAYESYAEIVAMCGNTKAAEADTIGAGLFAVLRWAVNYARYKFEAERENPATFEKWFSEFRDECVCECYADLRKRCDGGYTFRDGTEYGELHLIPAAIMSARNALRIVWRESFGKRCGKKYVETCPLSEALHDTYSATEMERVEIAAALHEAILSVESAKTRENLLGIEKWLREGCTAYEIALIIEKPLSTVQYWVKEVARKWVAGI